MDLLNSNNAFDRSPKLSFRSSSAADAKSEAQMHKEDQPDSPLEDTKLSWSSYSRWLHPQDLDTKAKLFNVDLSQEPFLLCIIKQIAETPLPPNWIEDKDGGGFVNQLSHEWQQRHPAHEFFQSQIQGLRRQRAQQWQHLQQEKDQDEDQNHGQAQAQEQQPPPHEASGWMEFYELNIETGKRVTYYYDFVTRKRQETHPAALLQGFSETRLANPQVFRGASTLHRKTAMKDLSRLEILCFTSWWTESRLVGPKKKHIRVYFSIATKHFQVVLEESDQVYTISHLIGVNGQLLEAWDLFIGARIAILGRLTTLMQASVLTTQWLEYHETNLQRLKQELLSELIKYDLRDHQHRPPKSLPRIECADPHHTKSGTSLRQLLNDIEELKRKLAHFRPDLVRRFAQPN